METQLCSPIAPEPIARLDIAKLTGNYYLAISTLALIAIPIGYAMGEGELDGSFILWYLLGSSLKKHSRVARWWALFIFTCASIMTLWSFFDANALVPIGPYVFTHSKPISYIIPALLWTAIAIPSILLLTKNGRDTFSIRQEYYRNKAKAGLTR